MGSKCSLQGSILPEQEITNSKQEKDTIQAFKEIEQTQLPAESHLSAHTLKIKINPLTQFSQMSSTLRDQLVISKTVEKQIKKKVSFLMTEKEILQKKGFEKKIALPVQNRKNSVDQKDLFKQKNKDNVFIMEDKIHEADGRQIQKILMKHFLFSQFSEKQRFSFIQQMKYCVGKEGTYIFRKGDESVSFYMILEGICKVERDEMTRNLQKGAYFGDLGLLHNFPRSASIFVKQPSLLVFLEKKAFQKAKQRLNYIFEEQNYQILSSITFFNQFSNSQKKYLATKCANINYEEGEIIFRNGDHAKNAYIIKEGICSDKSSTKFYKPYEIVDKDIIFDGITQRTYTLVAKTKCSLISFSKFEVNYLMTRSVVSVRQKEEVKNLIKSKKIKQGFHGCNWEKSFNNMVIIRFKQNDLLFSRGTPIKSNILYIIMKSSIQTYDIQHQFPAGSVIYRNDEEEREEYFQDNYFAQNQGYYAVIKINHDFSQPLSSYIITPLSHAKEYVELSKKNLLYLKKLHEGQNSQIFCCYEPQKRKKYAVKVYKKQEIAKGQFMKYMLREGEVLSQILSPGSPFIVKYLGTIDDHRNIQVIFQMVEGQNLVDLLSRMTLKKDQIRLIISQALLALQILHKHKIIYRNLKKDNIMICTDGYLKLIDFGISHITNEDNRFRTSTIIGTPQYMSPEMVIGRGYGFQVDLWSLGILLYELTFESLPFQNTDDPLMVFDQILNEELKFPNESELGCKKLLKRLLHKSKCNRVGGGLQQIKQWVYFKKINWQRLQNRQIRQSIRSQIRGPISQEETKECIRKGLEFSKMIENDFNSQYEFND